MISIIDRYQSTGAPLSETATAKLFMHGRSQAVRLPKEFRMPGDRVRVRRVGNTVVLEPISSDVHEWVAALQQFSHVPFMEDGREQPPMPPEKKLFD